MIKFNQYWAIDHSSRKDYGQFILEDYIPVLAKLNVEVVAGWMVLVGEYSEVVFECTSEGLAALEVTLGSDEYKRINLELQKRTRNFKTKILTNTGRYGTYSANVDRKSLKFIQSWDIKKGRLKEYDRFVRKEFYPLLDSMGLEVFGEWQVLLGEGPTMICECRSDKASKALENIESKAFQKKRAILKNLVEDYRSRLLIPHIYKIERDNSSYETNII